MPPITINLGFIKIELVELIKFLKDISTVKLDKESANAIHAAIIEVSRGYGIIINTMFPFYSLAIDENFETEFREKYQTFVKLYKSGTVDRSVSCSKVYDMIDELIKENKQTIFKKRFPSVKKELRNLRKLANKWFLNDTRVIKTMDEFHAKLEKRLANIPQKIEKGKQIDAWNELQYLLNEPKPKLDEIARQLNELSALDVKIKRYQRGKT
jgi:hypothetical protein